MGSDKTMQVVLPLQGGREAYIYLLTLVVGCAFILTAFGIRHLLKIRGRRKAEELFLKWTGATGQGAQRSPAFSERFLIVAGEIFPALAATFLTFAIIGYFLGERFSPEYSKPAASDRATAEFLAGNAVLEMTEEGIVVSRRIVCGPFTYEFRHGSRDVIERPTRDEERRFDISASAKPKISPEVLLALFLGGGGHNFNIPASYDRVGKVVKSGSGSAKTAILFAAPVSLVSGIGLGYWWGYDVHPDCQDPVFLQSIGKPLVWEASCPPVLTCGRVAEPQQTRLSTVAELAEKMSKEAVKTADPESPIRGLEIRTD